MSGDVLGPRALGRATLARQLLLQRAEIGALDAVEHLVGMQARIPLDPYLGLSSRLARFAHGELAQLLLRREVVRIVVMRATIHLVSAGDCLVLRPLMQPVLDAELRRHATFAPALDASTSRRCSALVQVPPRGVWGRTTQVTYTTAESWLGRPLADRPSIDDVVLRYLAAFGPATVADIASWSRLTGMRAVVDRIAARLRVFRDERGSELYDLPDAPRPDPDTVLVDGLVRATWRIDRAGDGATLLVDHRGRLSRAEADDVEAEGRRMLAFLEPEHPAARSQVRLVRLDP